MMTTTSSGRRDSAVHVRPRGFTNIACARRSRRLEDRAADRRGDDTAACMAQLIGAAQPRAQPAREQRRREEPPEAELEPLPPGEHQCAVAVAQAAALGEIDVEAARTLD